MLMRMRMMMLKMMIMMVITFVNKMALSPHMDVSFALHALIL